MNISLLLQMAADTAPGGVALFCEGRSWTYAELSDAAISAAHSFLASGCTHVALLDESSEAAAIALFGAARAGIPYVPLNYRLADADLGALLDRVAPAFLIGDRARIELLTSAPGHVVQTRSEFIVAADGPNQWPELEESDEPIAVQLFTSGTTSAPKAAILRHSNLMSYILGTVEFASAADGEAVLVSVPPYHIAGIAALLSSVYAMRRILLLPAFDPDAWLDLVSSEGATNAFVVPTMLSRIVTSVERSGAPDVSCLRSIAYGGGRMPLELIDKALDIFPETNFTNAYGLTETSSTVSLLGPEEHRAAHRSTDSMVRARLTSVGRPLPTIELEIRDEAGNVLPFGEQGEIYLRGDQVSGEYRDRSALDPDGWFPTRDAGWLDSEGYLFLAGRADDVIVRGGENISPGEIEDLLLAHPSVADASAVAMPSEEWGEAVGVALVLRDTSLPLTKDEVRSLIRDRLQSSRVPEDVRFVDALPYNEMGKLLRREVRKLFVT